MFPSYPNVYNLGHRLITGIFDGPVVVEEKIDGSQISFGLVDGALHVRSKNRAIDLDNPDSMFAKAVEVLVPLTGHLVEGVIYRGEYLQRPRHNTLAYERTPKGHIMLFDVEYPGQVFEAPDIRQTIAEHLGLEAVPVLWTGDCSLDDLRQALTRTSVLGKSLIEGVVIKNYERFTAHRNKIMIGKYVSEVFKEQNAQVHKPGPDIVAQVIMRYRTEARWRKAVQHLRDSGELLEEPKDIGPLIAEITQDVHRECAEEIAEMLLKHYWRQIQRGVTLGFPEWYKEQLAAAAFAEVA